jgi:hypothetical protein
MIEVLKQMYQLLLTEPHAPAVCDQLEVILRKAIAELESQEPVERDWREAPWGFGEKRLSTVEYSDIVSDGGLDPRNKFDTPPQRTEPVDYEKLAALGWQAIECGICGGGAMGYPQRTWVGLSMEQFEHFTSYVRADVLIEIEEALMENNT